ncbi:glycosyltransferase family 1 protein [Maribellus luteus]|uniref:Glycosyltransferase family 1 protein n=1 Tax=Maribellus luteus TaxID=2305463 RepID=A0A399T747_9BACT|nr:glycosyltransferase family 4 protein [Maribellus luteus]RIJ49713.1 glycosyltransferase family 1 protein [Maribellus luteus]
MKKKKLVISSDCIKYSCSDTDSFKLEDIYLFIKNKTIFKMFRKYDEVGIEEPTLMFIQYIFYKSLIAFFLSSRKSYFFDNKDTRQITIFFIFKQGWIWIYDLLRAPFMRLVVKRRLKKISHFNPETRTEGGISPIYIRQELFLGIKSGGSIGHMSGVINALLKKGLPPVFFSTDYIPEVSDEVKTNIVLPNNKFWNSEFDLILNFNQKVCSDIVSCIGEERPKFIYQRFGLGNFSGSQLAEKWNIPYIMEYNGSSINSRKMWSNSKTIKYEALFWEIIKTEANCANLIVVVSKPLKEELIELGVEKTKILVNPNGVDPEKYNPNITGDELIKKHSLENKTIIGFIGTFGVWHGVENLLEAYILLLKRNPDYRNTTKLMLIGDGKLMFQVKNRIEEENISDNVIVTGLVPQNEGPKYLSCCDILCAPTKPNPDGSRFFGSPTKLFEYMAMGKAIVSSDIEQQGEILEHQKDAILTKPGDVPALAEGISHLLEDSLLRDTLGRNARKKVIENYTWEKHTQKILDSLIQLQN